MNKIKLSRYFLYSVPAICFILFVIVGNDQIVLSIHKWFKSYEVVNIGNAVIKKPENWVLSYEKRKKDSNGYLYGFFPVKEKQNTTGEIVYMFKKVGEDNEVIFSELDPILKEKEKNLILAFSDKDKKQTFEIFNVFGFKAIKFKKNKYDDFEYSISIPDLDLHIVTDQPNNLIDFTISKSQ